MGARTDLPTRVACACSAARTTSLLLLEQGKSGPNPHSRAIIPEGAGQTVVQPWAGLLNVHSCYDPLPHVLHNRAVGYLPFQRHLSFTQIADYVPKLCSREVAWLLSNCICTEQSLGWQAAACKRPPERERGQDSEEATEMEKQAPLTKTR